MAVFRPRVDAVRAKYGTADTIAHVRIYGTCQAKKFIEETRVERTARKVPPITSEDKGRALRNASLCSSPEAHFSIGAFSNCGGVCLALITAFITAFIA